MYALINLLHFVDKNTSLSQYICFLDKIIIIKEIISFLFQLINIFQLLYKCNKANSFTDHHLPWSCHYLTAVVRIAIQSALNSFISASKQQENKTSLCELIPVLTGASCLMRSCCWCLAIRTAAVCRSCTCVGHRVCQCAWSWKMNDNNG